MPKGPVGQEAEPLVSLNVNHYPYNLFTYLETLLPRWMFGNFARIGNY